MVSAELGGVEVARPQDSVQVRGVVLDEGPHALLESSIIPLRSSILQVDEV